MDRTPGCTTDISELYIRYADALYRIAYAELLSKADAEDAVQEVFTKFIHKPQFFKDLNHEKSWFIRVTINHCHDTLRKHKIRAYTPLEKITELKATEKGTDSMLENILKLPEKFKTAILLFYYEDFSIEEISKILKISVSAVKMRLSRGREMLKQELETE